jgi:hypothetical protein
MPRDVAADDDLRLHERHADGHSQKRLEPITFSTVSLSEQSTEHPTRVAILTLLARTGSATVSMLSAELRVPLKRASYHAGVLERAGRLERDRAGWLSPKPRP